MPHTKTDEELRIKTLQVLDSVVIPGTLPEAVSDLLDALVTDMRQAAAQAAAGAREQVAAEERLATVESQVQVLTAALISVTESVTNLQRQLLNDAQAAEGGQVIKNSAEGNPGVMSVAVVRDEA
jgi:hypothetical protein